MSDVKIIGVSIRTNNISSVSTAEEILKELPEGYMIIKRIIKGKEEYLCCNINSYETDFDMVDFKLGKMIDKIPANTCAKMWLYLKDNKLIK